MVAATLQQALALHRQGRVADAARLYAEVLRAEPDNFDALHLAGVAAYQSGAFARGAELIARAVARNPRVADAHSNLGNALRALNRPAEALACYDAALALQPDNAVARNNRGIVLSELERHEEALESFDAALALKPDYAEALSNRGNVLSKLGRNLEAVASLDAALVRHPAYAEAHYNRGIALFDLDRCEDAVASYDRAVAIRPDYPAAHYNRGIALHALKRIEEAIASYDRAVALKPDYAEAQWNRCLCLLLLGRFAQGWTLYEWRKRQRVPIGLRRFPQPEWTGAEDLAGKTLFVHAEQGLGDTIQFARYLPLLAERGANVILSAQDALTSLMQGLGRGIAVVNSKTVPDVFDYHAALMSLPGAFGTDAQSIPARLPYLAAEPARVRRWRDRIGAQGLRIGICWQGSTGPIDRGRSFPLSRFAPLARLPGVRLIGLQRDAGLAQLQDLPAGLAVETYDAPPNPEGFLETAALMEALDLVITCDTAVAHLAGALARPVWIVLKQVAEWRWLTDRADSPWYPTARLFRQPRAGDWEGAFAAVEQALAAERGRHAAGQAPFIAERPAPTL